MNILIGGSGSSGSTLLRTLLNGHPDIFSGDELSLFNKKLAYVNWNEFCRSLDYRLKTSRCTEGWFPFPEINMTDSEYGWQIDELRSQVNLSHSLAEFSKSFYQRPLEIHRKSVWIEKTPSNAYCFPEFLDTFPEGKVIHLVRDPYDSITSLIKRGFSVYFAVGVWVINNAFALRVENDCRYLRIHYEDLCAETDETINALINFLGLSGAWVSRTPINNSGGVSNIASWRNSPTSAVSQSSIGGFYKLPPHQQALIRFVASAFYISPVYQSLHGLTNISVSELASHFGYEAQLEEPDFKMRLHLCKDYLRDRGSRFKNCYPNASRTYPAGIKLIGV